MPTPLFTAPREKAKIASNRGLTMRVLRPREEHAGQKPTGLVAAGFLNPKEKSAQHTLRHIPKNNRGRYTKGTKRSHKGHKRFSFLCFLCLMCAFCVLFALLLGKLPHHPVVEVVMTHPFGVHFGA